MCGQEGWCRQAKHNEKDCLRTCRRRRKRKVRQGTPAAELSFTCRVTSKTLTTALVLLSKTPIIDSSLQGRTRIQLQANAYCEFVVSAYSVLGKLAFPRLPQCWGYLWRSPGSLTGNMMLGHAIPGR